MKFCTLRHTQWNSIFEAWASSVIRCNFRFIANLNIHVSLKQGKFDTSDDLCNDVNDIHICSWMLFCYSSLPQNVLYAFVISFAVAKKYMQVEPFFIDIPSPGILITLNEILYLSHTLWNSIFEAFIYSTASASFSRLNVFSECDILLTCGTIFETLTWKCHWLSWSLTNKYQELCADDASWNKIKNGNPLGVHPGKWLGVRLYALSVRPDIIDS